MNTIKNTILFYMTAILFVLIFFAGTAFAQLLRVDSVTVDSVWNSDSSFYDNNGILQTRISRDIIVGFKPFGQDSVHARFVISTDSARTWSPSPVPLVVLDKSLVTSFACNQRHQSKLRVLGGDREKVAIKVIVRNKTKPLELLQPVGGESYTSGETMKIQWKINDTMHVSSVGIKLSTDNGVSFSYIADHSFLPSLTSYNWTVDTALISNQCTIMIADYIDGSINDKSGLFSINKEIVVFNDGFETDLSNYRPSSYAPGQGMMSISKQCAYSGAGSLTSDSNNTGIKRVINPLITDSIAGLQFYLMATKTGQNLMAAMCKSGSSPTGLYTILGMGIDKSDSLRYVYENSPDDTINEHKNFAVLTLNKWYKCRIEYDFTDTTLTYYVDGEIVRKRSAPNPMALSTFVVMRDSLGAQGPSGCYLDDVIICKR